MQVRVLFPLSSQAQVIHKLVIAPHYCSTNMKFMALVVFTTMVLGVVSMDCKMAGIVVLLLSADRQGENAYNTPFMEQEPIVI